MSQQQRVSLSSVATGFLSFLPEALLYSLTSVQLTREPTQRRRVNIDTHGSKWICVCVRVTRGFLSA